MRINDYKLVMLQLYATINLKVHARTHSSYVNVNFRSQLTAIYAKFLP